MKEIHIRNLREADYEKCIDFAIEGMNFHRYFKDERQTRLYGTHFFNEEIQKASIALGAYHENELLGVILCSLKDGPRPFKKLKRGLFIKGADLLKRTVFRKSSAYDEANEKMLKALKEREDLEGEITFFAADPEKKIKGVGSGLLRALESRIKGKTIYLFTDKDCNYKFYERRGFSREEEESVVVDMGDRQVPLTCYLYMKKIEA